MLVPPAAWSMVGDGDRSRRCVARAAAVGTLALSSGPRMEIVKRNHCDWVLATQHPAQSYTVTMKISQLKSVHSVQSASVYSNSMVSKPFPSISFNFFFSFECGFAGYPTGISVGIFFLIKSEHLIWLPDRASSLVIHNSMDVLCAIYNKTEEFDHSWSLK